MLLPEPRTRCLAPAGVHRVPGLPRFRGTCSQWLDFMLFGIPISRFQICPVHILNIPSSPHPSIFYYWQIVSSSVYMHLTLAH